MPFASSGVALKILRIVIGILLALAAGPFLIQGGLSRYAAFGVPAHPDSRMLVIGLILLAAAAFLIRPAIRAVNHPAKQR
jgi:hypothetical protein